MYRLDSAFAFEDLLPSRLERERDSADDSLWVFLDSSKMCPAAIAREIFSSLESLSARAEKREEGRGD